MIDINSVFKLVQKLKKFYENQLMPIMLSYDLTKNQLDIILFFTNHPHYSTLSEIVEHRMLAKSQVSASIDDLCSRGLMVKELDGEDKRSYKLIIDSSANVIQRLAVTAQKRAVQEMLKNVRAKDLDIVSNVFGIIDCNIAIN